jgi:undecaprenyl-diphosphatase
VLLGSDDKAFEVFLHAGTAAALVIALRDEVAEVASGLDSERLARIALTLAPAALAGLALDGPIEKRLGKRAVAAAQVAGGAALLAADRSPGMRAHSDAGARDALLIGVAQACALVPGVSRNGATLTAARLLGFRRDAASRMSRHAALPVIAGATALKLRDLPRSRAHVAGLTAAFASSLAAARLVPRIDRLRTYAPFGLYRIALGTFFLLNGRDG